MKRKKKKIKYRPPIPPFIVTKIKETETEVYYKINEEKIAKLNKKGKYFHCNGIPYVSLDKNKFKEAIALRKILMNLIEFPNVIEIVLKKG